MGRDAGAIIGAIGAGLGAYGEGVANTRARNGMIDLAGARFAQLGTPEAMQFAKQIASNPDAAGQYAEQFGGFDKLYAGMEERALQARVAKTMTSTPDNIPPRAYMAQLIQNGIEPQTAAYITQTVYSQGGGGLPDDFPKFQKWMEPGSYAKAARRAIENPDQLPEAIADIRVRPGAEGGKPPKVTRSDVQLGLERKHAQATAWRQQHPDAPPDENPYAFTQSEANLLSTLRSRTYSGLVPGMPPITEGALPMEGLVRGQPLQRQAPGEAEPPPAASAAPAPDEEKSGGVVSDVVSAFGSWLTGGDSSVSEDVKKKLKERGGKP